MTAPDYPDGTPVSTSPVPSGCTNTQETARFIWRCVEQGPHTDCYMRPERKPR